MANEVNSVRPEKKAIVAEIRERLDNAKFAILADFKGMSVEQSGDIRAKLRECDTRMFVAKNRLIELAMEGKSYSDLWKSVLNENSVLIAGTGDPVATAKVLDGFHKENGILAAKSGMLNGKGLTAEEVKQLVDLPGKQELQGKLVGTLVAPMRQLAGVFHQKQASIVYVLKAIQDKKEAA